MKAKYSERAITPQEIILVGFILEKETRKINDADCYLLAKYKATTYKSAGANVARVLKRPQVARYLAEQKIELSKSLIEKTGYTKQRLIKEFENIKEKCLSEVEVKNHKGEKTGEYKIDASSAVKALENIGKITGAYTESEKNNRVDINALADLFKTKDL